MISHQPPVGSILLCDFAGMTPPEMVKRRDVVVIARNRNKQLVTVVPLSTTRPERLQPYHHPLSFDPRPDGDTMRQVWVKSDMLYTVSLARLDRYRRRAGGGWQFINVTGPAAEFETIRKCVAIALQLADNEDVTTA